MSNVINSSNLTADEKRKCQIVSLAKSLDFRVREQKGTDGETYLHLSNGKNNCFIKEKEMNDTQYISSLVNICDAAGVKSKRLQEILDNEDQDKLYEDIRKEALSRRPEFASNRSLYEKQMYFARMTESDITKLKNVGLSEDAIRLIEQQTNENSRDSEIFLAERKSATKGKAKEFVKGAVNKVKGAIENVAGKIEEFLSEERSVVNDKRRAQIKEEELGEE